MDTAHSSEFFEKEPSLGPTSKPVFDLDTDHKMDTNNREMMAKMTEYFNAQMVLQKAE